MADPKPVVTNVGLVPLMEADSVIFDFVNPKAIAAAFRSAGWDAEQEIKALVQIAKDAESLKSRLHAIAALRQRVLEALSIAGVIGSVEISQKTDGGRIRLKLRGVQRALAIATGKDVPNVQDHRPPELEVLEGEATVIPDREDEEGFPAEEACEVESSPGAAGSEGEEAALEGSSEEEVYSPGDGGGEDEPEAPDGED